MSALDLAVLLSAAVAGSAAIIGVNVRLSLQMQHRITDLERVVARLEHWHDKWQTLPDDMSDATMLDRRLRDIEVRLSHIEASIERGHHDEP